MKHGLEYRVSRADACSGGRVMGGVGGSSPIGTILITLVRSSWTLRRRAPQIGRLKCPM